MAGIAVAFAVEQLVTGHLVRSQRVLALQEGVEFRRERADTRRAFVFGEGLPPVIIDVVRLGAVFRTQLEWAWRCRRIPQPLQAYRRSSPCSCGNLMSNELPHTASNSGLYSAVDSRNAMQAVSGKPISRVSTGGCCACSASALCSLYPVARESQKFPPKNGPCWLYWSTGKSGEYVYRCAVRLPARK